MAKVHTLGLFNDFEAAALAVADLKSSKLAGFNMDDVTLKSPIEHPEISEALGHRPVYIQIFTLIGSVLGAALGFLFIASAQANFMTQPKGSIPLIPLPPDLVLTYELLILSGVLVTVATCFYAWHQPGRKSPLYNASVSADKIGILVRAEVDTIPAINEIFTRRMALEIMGEPAK